MNFKTFVNDLLIGVLVGTVLFGGLYVLSTVFNHTFYILGLAYIFLGVVILVLIYKGFDILIYFIKILAHHKEV